MQGSWALALPRTAALTLTLTLTLALTLTITITLTLTPALTLASVNRREGAVLGLAQLQLAEQQLRHLYPTSNLVRVRVGSGSGLGVGVGVGLEPLV